jgi:hypothetical protein
VLIRALERLISTLFGDASLSLPITPERRRMTLDLQRGDYIND